MNKGLKVLTVLVWLLFLGMIGAICYLSFQDGESAKEIDRIFTDKVIAYLYSGEELSTEKLVEVTNTIRQFGRIVLFFTLGVLGTAAIHLAFHKINWLLRTIISVVVLVGIAVFTERYKMYLPTRHFSEEEMVLSIEGAILGFLFISVVSFVFGILAWIFKKLFKRK